MEANISNSNNNKIDKLILDNREKLNKGLEKYFGSDNNKRSIESANLIAKNYQSNNK
jgi:hypothetical protein